VYISTPRPPLSVRSKHRHAGWHDSHGACQLNLPFQHPVHTWTPCTHPWASFPPPGAARARQRRGHAAAGMGRRPARPPLLHPALGSADGVDPSRPARPGPAAARPPLACGGGHGRQSPTPPPPPRSISPGRRGPASDRHAPSPSSAASKDGDPRPVLPPPPPNRPACPPTGRPAHATPPGGRFGAPRRGWGRDPLPSGYVIKVVIADSSLPSRHSARKAAAP
jgi:hypothetical protein